jgi:hypothetical protein
LKIEVMRKTAAAAILGLAVCAACLTPEDLECRDDDMCLAVHADTRRPPVPASGTSLNESR